MDINPDADLDTSQVEDDRGSSGGGGLGGRVAVGGGGVSIVGVIIYLILSQLGGGGGGSLPGGYPGGSDSGYESGAPADGGEIAQNCQVGQAAKDRTDCEVVAIVNSVQSYWAGEFAQSGRKYVPSVTHVFSQRYNTGCGAATADVGPFYCPADKSVYLDLAFYDELTSRFGAQGGGFAHAYVLAHEYGHHVQDLLGRSAGGSATGAASGSVRLELQADCYAGVWANHATKTNTASGKPIFRNVTQADLNAALDTASRIGDDYIQSKIGGQQVDQSEFTHGSSAQREKWLTTGLKTGDPAQCNTFDRHVDLG